METFLSLASFVILLLFAYGTWKIERTLTKVEQHLERIRNIASDMSPNDRL
jgi:hypothetical protein